MIGARSAGRIRGVPRLQPRSVLLAQTSRAYIGSRPSRRVIQRLCREVSELSGRRWLLVDVRGRVARRNHLLVGWSN